MQQTISINLAGLVFHIEKDAFDELQNYLDQVKQYLANNESREEIIQDIESRIAEIFQERLSSRKEALTMADIQAVRTALGEPKTFQGTADNQAGESQDEGKQEESYTRKGQVHRDIDDKVIGGVCSGIGQYYNIDPLWLRLGFVAAVLLSGSGILLYIILWIIIPAAKTPVQKMEMRGERVTVSNIERSFAGDDGSKKSSNNQGKKHQFRAKGKNVTEEGKSALKTVLDALENGFAKLGQACRKATSKLEKN